MTRKVTMTDGVRRIAMAGKAFPKPPESGLAEFHRSVTMTNPTQPRLEEIRRRLAGISPGEWQDPHLCSDTTTCNCAAVLCDGYFGAICTVHVSNGLLVSDGGNDDPPLEEAKANGRLIANAPQDLAWLLDRVAELEQQIVVHECEVSQLRHLVFNAGTMLLGKLPAKEKSGE